MKAKNLIIVLILTLIMSLNLEAIKPPIGTANFVLGKAKVMKTNKTIVRLKKGYRFYGGERVVTYSRASVKIKLKDGSTIKVLQKSQVIINKIKFGEDKNRYSLGVVKGGLRSKVNKLRSKDYYRVYTPTTVAGVRGTEFLVAVGVNGKSNVMVKEGVINLEGEESKESVKGGEQAEISLEEEIKKEDTEKVNLDKENDKFQRKNKKIDNPEKSIKIAADRMKRIEAKNKERVGELKKKKKLTEEEQDELDSLYQRSVNQSQGWYGLSRVIFKKYKNRPLIKKNFYEVQRRLRSIDDQIKEMDAFIEKMSKEMDEFTDDVSKDLDDMEKGFIKKKKGK